MKTCLYLVEIFLSLHTVLLLRFSLAVCDGGSFIFRNCLICCWMAIPPLINPFSCGWTSGLFLEFYDYGQCRRPWRLLGWGVRGVAYNQESHQSWEESWAFHNLFWSRCDPVTSPHSRGDSSRWQFLFFIVLKYTQHRITTLTIFSVWLSGIKCTHRAVVHERSKAEQLPGMIFMPRFLPRILHT